MDEYQLPEISCPACGHLIDAAANLIGDCALHVGTMTVCIYCSAVLRFCEENRLQQISNDELVELALKNPRAFSLLAKIQNVCRSAMKDKKTEASILTGTSFCNKKTPRRRRHRKNESAGLKGRVES